MANDRVHLLSPLVSDGGTLSGGSWRAGLPITNIQHSDLARVARSTTAAAADTQWRLDVGSAPPRSWSMFAILAHNLTTDAQWRVVCTDDPADNEVNRLYDSGWLDVWEPTTPWGSLPWGVFPWDGLDLTAYPNHPLTLHTADVSTIARYVFVYVSDTSNPDGYVDVGRFVAGEAWSPERNVAYGFSVRWADTSDVSRTEGGRRLVRQRAKYRIASMTFESLTPGEAWGRIFEIMKLGKDTELLLVANPLESADIRFKRSFLGALVNPEAVPEMSHLRLQTQIVLEELL